MMGASVVVALTIFQNHPVQSVSVVGVVLAITGLELCAQIVRRSYELA